MKKIITGIALISCILLGNGCFSYAVHQRNTHRSIIRVMETASGGPGIGVDILMMRQFTWSEIGLQGLAALGDATTILVSFESGPSV